MKGDKKILALSVMVLLLAVCFTSYAIYKSSASASGGVSAAAWVVKVNNSNIVTSDTFTLDNVNHIKKMSYIMIASIIIATIASSFMSAAFARDIMVNINMYNIVEIIFLFALSYIFEYGYEIQLDSKGKIYGNTKE